MKKRIRELFKKVKLLILDVDGVLTRGEIIYDDQGRELKVFNVKDGFGVLLLSKLGIKTILLSARNSTILKKRAQDMRVAEVIGGILPKEKAMGHIKRKYKVKEQEICFIGDDLIDLGMVKKVGLGIAVADATKVVRKAADYVTESKGGQGAVREVVDLVIKEKRLNKKVSRLIMLILIIIFMPLNMQVFSQQKVKDFYLSSFKEDGTRDWDVEGTEAVIEGDDVNITDMKANYFVKDDTVVITSEKAVINKKTMDAQLNDNVQIQNKGGSTLVTESLNWQSKKNHVETDDRVKVTKDSMEITSEGMSADTLLQDADFKKDVEVVFPDPETQEVSTITCDGLLEIEYELGKAVFNDNVVALHTQGKIFADKLTLYFDTETNTIKQMVSEGNVKIVKGNNISFADKATYIGKTQKLILEGRPRLVYFPEEDSEDDSPF